MTANEINETLKQLKEYTALKKDLEAEITHLQDECKKYMTENELSELFNDDKTIVARYTEVVSNRFDSTNFKKSGFGELYSQFLKKVTSMRFSLN